MHILHLLKTSEGGAWALEFIQELSHRYKKEITFSVVIPSGGRHFIKYKEVCFKVYEFDFNLDFTLFRQGQLLRKIVNEDKPDLIHSWFAPTTLYARLFLRDFKIPRLFEVVGPLHLEFVLYRLFDIFSAQQNDYWKATSLYTYNLYLKYGIKEEKLFFNYIAGNLQESIDIANNYPTVNLRNKYNIPENIKIIGTASYMYPPKKFRKHGVKNHEMLLQVFKQLLKKRSDVVLIIGGTTIGPNKSYELKLKKIARSISEDKIIFTGWVNNLSRLITEYDAFVFLSLSENLGGVYESLLYQVPTVASNRGGIPELVIDGETGYTLDLKSIDDIIDRIERILDYKEISEKFRRNGLTKVHEVFQKDKSIRKSYEIYCHLLN